MRVSDDLINELGRLPTQTIIDALWVQGWPLSMIHGSRAIF